MKKSYETFRRNFENAKRIWNLEEDWITPVEYLPYIDALLGDIDLDPCSTEKANKDFIHAKNFYTKKEDGLNTEIAWTGKVYCFPPTYGRCSYSKKRGSWRWSLRGGAGAMSPSIAWFRRLEKEWKLRNIYEALFFLESPLLSKSVAPLVILSIVPPSTPAKPLSLATSKGVCCVSYPN